MTRPSPGSDRLLATFAAAALMIACARPPVASPAPAGPDHALTFDGERSGACWATWQVGEGTHTGDGALRLTGGDEYVPLLRTTIGAIGSRLNTVRLSYWAHVPGTSRKLCTTVLVTPTRGKVMRAYSRTIRSGELPRNTWCEVHTEVGLPGWALSPEDRVDVVLWNEGGNTMTVDDARITFVGPDVPGSTPGTPFDPTQLIDGRDPDGRVPDPRYATPNDTLP